MTFEQAVDCLKIGEYVRRKTWLNGLYIKMVDDLYVLTDSNTGLHMQWRPCQGDKRAENWACCYIANDVTKISKSAGDILSTLNRKDVISQLHKTINLLMKKEKIPMSLSKAYWDMEEKEWAEFYYIIALNNRDSQLKIISNVLQIFEGGENGHNTQD